MSTIDVLARGNAGARKLLVAGAIAIPAALLVAWIVTTAAAYRAVIEQDRQNEMTAESRALCAKWGMPQGSAKYAGCVADIQTIRDRHQQRLTEDLDAM